MLYIAIWLVKQLLRARHGLYGQVIVSLDFASGILFRIEMF